MARSNQIARVVGVAGAVALVALYFAGSRSESTDQSPTASASPSGLPPSHPGPADLIALLDGLRVGDDVSGWKVHSIDPPADGVAWVSMRRDDAVFGVGIVRKGTSKAPPPIVLDAYEIGYGRVTSGLPGDAMAGVAQAIADRVRKTEKSVPVPAGM